MGIKLPQDGYSAMELINQLANAGHIAGVGYQTKKVGGKTVLVAIRAQVGTVIEVDEPGPIARANSGMLKLGPKSGTSIINKN